MTLLDTANLLGNFGEFFGSVLLVVSLIYVGLQIRQNTKATKADMADRITGRLNDEAVTFFVNPDTVEFVINHENSSNKLTELDQRRWINLFNLRLRSAENVYSQIQMGMLDRRKALLYMAPFVGNLHKVRWALTWSQLSTFLDPEFVAFCNELSNKWSSGAGETAAVTEGAIQE